MLKATCIALVVYFLGLHSIPAECKEVSDETKQEILAVANGVSKASEDRNVEKLMSYLTSDALIIVGSSNKNPRSYTYESYKKFIEYSFGQISYYKYKRSNEVFYQDKDEIVFSFLLEENYVVNSNYIKEHHTEKWNLRREAGALKAYKILADERRITRRSRPWLRHWTSPIGACFAFYAPLVAAP